MIERAPINIVIAADYGRTTGSYGQRGIRYVHMEVGHVGQNISLQAFALNLGTVMIGAFEDKQVKEILGIEEEPLYIIPIGKI
jgi:SagB-type dehydrogenase family enzyme